MRKVGWRSLRITLKIGKGWPDVICFRPDGVAEFYEVKTGKAKLNPDQVERCDALARMGYQVKIMRDPMRAEEVHKWKRRKG